MKLQPKTLDWTMSGDDPRQWIGKPEGITGVVVALFESPTANDHWWIVPTFRNAKVADHPGFDAAKEEAQALFSAFANALFVSISAPSCIPVSSSHPEVTHNPFLTRSKDQYDSEANAWKAVSIKTGYHRHQVKPCHSAHHWRWRIETDADGCLLTPKQEGK